ncbi:MAG: PAS domain S-box protein [Ignavibacteriaceae bacterium]|nr:PAS domain S-box protein [Ignavibacteriaceae bacterium]
MSDKTNKTITSSNKIKLTVKLKNLEVLDFSKSAKKLFLQPASSTKKIYLTDLIITKNISKELGKLQKLSKSQQIKIDEIRIKKNNTISKTYSLKAKFFEQGKDKLLDCTFNEMKSKTKKNDLQLLEIQRTNKKLKTIFNNNPLMIFIIDKDGIIRELNKCGAKELGFKESELINQPVTKVFLRKDWSTVKKQIKECLTNPGKMFTWEIKKIKKNGDIIWVRENARTIPSNGKNKDVLIVCENITQKKEAEKALNETTRKISQILDASPYGVHIYELNEKDELIFSGFNSAANKILGIDHSELINKKLEEAFPDLINTDVPDVYRKIARNGSHIDDEVIDYEDNHVRGSFNFTALQIEPGKIASFFSDITEKKKAYEKLEKSELKFKSLFELANDAIFLMNSDIFINCNKKTLEIFECNPEDIIGKPPYHFSPEKQPDGRDSKEKALEKIKAALDGTPQRFEWKHKRFSGELFDAEVSLNRIILGEDILLQAIVRDITKRKKAEEQISMLAHALKSISETVCITDMMENIIFANNAFNNTFGYNKEEVIGKHISLIRSDKNTSNVINQILPATLKGGWKGELIARKKSGEEFLISLSTSVIKNDENIPIALISVAVDITDRKKFENELQQSRQMLQLILDNVPQRIFWKDINSKYLGCNKSFAKDAGLSTPDEIIGASDYDMPWKSAEADFYRSIDSEVMKNDKPVYHLIEPQTHLNGEISWLETNKIPLHDKLGNVVGILGTYEDISERKKSEEALKESEERFRSLIDNMIEAALIIDWDGEIIFANNSAAKLVGLSDPKQGIGKKVFNFLHPDYNERVLKAIVQARESLTPIVDEYKIITESGEYRWVESLGTKIIYSNRKCILVTLRDVTERKYAEIELREAKEKAEEMSKIKSNFLANMSHELRTPLVGILGFAELLKENLQGTHHAEMTDRILTSANRLLDTLNLLLDLARIEARKVDINIKPYKISELVVSQVLLFEAVAERKNLYLKTEVVKNDLYAPVDEQIFRQIMNNLINNALKYTDNGGVKITVDSVIENTNSFARVTVEDTGIGIPENSLGLIFQEFRQVSEGFNRHFEGTGLGLTITKNFVEMMNGQIKVKSTVGAGSTFTVLFPLLQNFEQAEIPDIKVTNEAKISDKLLIPGFKQNLLVVDNDDSSRDIIKLFLKDLCVMDFADSGEEAIQLVNKKSFDIILMDINLGKGISGVDTTKAIRKIESYRKIPIVAITGFAMRGDREEFIQAGCTHYLSKPFTRTKLIKLISEIASNKEA